MPVWIETLPESKNGKELVIKIKPFMRRLNYREAHGNTEGKIKRKEVCKRLAYYGYQIEGRDGTVERLRCAYALPIMVKYEGLEAAKRE
jgi:hypothetical protein